MEIPDQTIIHLAEALAGEYFFNRSNVDPYEVFDDYEVICIEDDFGDDFEGLIRFKDGEYQVFVNRGHLSSRTVGRKRFTAAHELGHCMIAEHRSAIRSGNGVHKSISGFESKLPMEREADIFASHFLIPSNKLLKFCGKGIWGATEILDVAEHFKTSVTCAALRCQSTLPGHSTLVLWTKEKVRWQRMDRDWWFELPAKTIRTADKLIVGSATERVLNGEELNGAEYLQAGTTRSTWFPRIAKWSGENDLLIEEAIPLGSYGVLTLLRPDSF